MGYYRYCNLCGGSYSGPAGARAYIRHLRETGCGTYYGHQADGYGYGDFRLAFDIWLWYSTGKERDFLRSVDQPVDREFRWTPSAGCVMG